MRLNIFNLKLKKQKDIIDLLHWGHFTALLSIIILNSVQIGLFRSVIYLSFAALFYKLYFKTVKELFYTYWSFTALIFIYFFIQLFAPSDQITFMALLGMGFLIYESYLLSSPIYFPRVRWWEYDFRYKEELKIQVKANGLKNSIEGRMTDLRQRAGCVLLFEDLNVGDVIQIEIEGPQKVYKLESEIFSKREYLQGRGISYGVKFNLSSEIELDEFESLRGRWRDDLIEKRKKKYLLT